LITELKNINGNMVRCPLKDQTSRLQNQQKNTMESKTFAGTSARRYRIVDAEVRWWWILFDIISWFGGLKSMDINKTNKSKNVKHNIKFTFLHQKKFSKTKYIEPCDVICHVTVAFYIYHFMCDTSIDAYKRQLQQIWTH
jgi:hypothetical protein